MAAPQTKAGGKVTGVAEFSESGMEALPLGVVETYGWRGTGGRDGEKQGPERH
ncbi:hypothetical protein GCM10010303_25310 [Streptomyces purpurascens]|nr:hypothetical protein GCM10010303_25310 [Streptomyces purpurascens]